MFRLVAFTFLIILGLVVGCGSKATTQIADTRPDTLEVPSAPIPSAEPMAQQPVFDEPMIQPRPQPVTQTVAMTTPAPAAKASASGNTYTVKKGDTLTSIARKQYGTGDWKKIAAANPGLQPNNIKAGQKIVIP